MLALEFFGFYPPKFFFWGVSESFRKAIGQFHSPRMKPCKSADYFIKVNFHVVVDKEQSESCQSVNFNWERFFLRYYQKSFIMKNLTDFC